MDKASTTRFSDRVQNYVRYRPGYPAEVLHILRDGCGLTPNHLVADIAAGTGTFTRLLLQHGNRVFAVEPNAEMRDAAIGLLTDFESVSFVTGTAEQTTLAGESVDFVTAAQAAHWFDRDRARREFSRILRPHGWCALIWNERRTDGTPFLREYEDLLMKFGTDYKEVRHEQTTATISDFFAPMPYQEETAEMRQEFDFEGLAGRLLSSSYAPLEDHPSHAPMMKELERIFRKHAKDGTVEFEYTTRVFFGRLG